ncbi:hypothetical protein MBLNU457_g3045t1 [Dothideomycetes sp. NU457]
MANQSNDTFDLLRLLPELRLMIYEEAHHSEPPPTRVFRVSTGTCYKDMRASLTNCAPNINLLLTSPDISDEINKVLLKDQVLRVELSITEEYLWGGYSFSRGAQVDQLPRFLCSKIKHAPLYAPPTLSGVEVELTIPRYWSDYLGAGATVWEKKSLDRIVLAVADKLNKLKGDLLSDGGKRPVTLDKFTLRLVTIDDDEYQWFDMKQLNDFALKNELGMPNSIEVIHEHAGEEASLYDQEFFDKKSRDATRRLREVWVQCLSKLETNAP